jgi:hypothetical protein
LLEKTKSDTSIYYSQISKILEKIYFYIQKLEVPYKKLHSKEFDSPTTQEYPFNYFWIDYLKIPRKFFKKAEQNPKSLIENESNSSNKIYDFQLITNEIAIILEESHFIENIISFLV